MQETTARLPVGAGWVDELKGDGMRAVVEVGIGDLPVRGLPRHRLSGRAAAP